MITYFIPSTPPVVKTEVCMPNTHKYKMCGTTLQCTDCSSKIVFSPKK